VNWLKVDEGKWIDLDRVGWVVDLRNKTKSHKVSFGERLDGPDSWELNRAEADTFMQAFLQHIARRTEPPLPVGLDVTTEEMLL
jgi:hypothetical protein